MIDNISSGVRDLAYPTHASMMRWNISLVTHDSMAGTKKCPLPYKNVFLNRIIQVKVSIDTELHQSNEV